MWCLYLFVVSVLVTTSAGPVTENYKDQFCTDPRTMHKHAPYTEWADAYSCTRHRCQPGGRNLAIYTVGCKRVEAPESAIECEEVVEDTNMQFPFCCTRLRCLVVVRGEVWTRVLGQPWETLPAAPWSHMYKKKKPPPPNGTLLNKNAGTGPIYELAPDAEASPQKVLRASKKTTGPPDADCNDAKPIQVPDIVIALATEPETKEQKKSDNRHKRRKTSHATSEETDKQLRNNEVEFEDAVIITDRAPEASEEKMNSVTRKASNSKNHAAWTEIPQKEWNEQDPSTDTENTFKESPRASAEKQPALQALVDAIGSRMRDIEDVVQRMSQKVSQGKPGEDSGEKRAPDHLSDAEVVPPRSHHKSQQPDHFAVMKPKQPSPDNEHYKRFTVLNRGSKYLRTTDGPASEPPLFVEDAHLNGYFSDASNSVQRRVNPPKEPAQYVAPVDTHHKTHILSDGSDETRKHSRRAHKKKGKGHKKHHGKDKRKKIRVISTESDRNTVSLEDNSAIVNL